MIRSGVVGATGLLLFAIFVPRLALASTTENGITVSSQQIFADNRGINDIGEAQGLVLQLGRYTRWIRGLFRRWTLHAHWVRDTVNSADSDRLRTVFR
jgi:hypothetical protein